MDDVGPEALHDGVELGRRRARPDRVARHREATRLVERLVVAGEPFDDVPGALEQRGLGGEDRVLAARLAIEGVDREDAQRVAQDGSVSSCSSRRTSSTWRLTPALRLACLRCVRTVSIEHPRSAAICASGTPCASIREVSHSLRVQS